MNQSINKGPTSLFLKKLIQSQKFTFVVVHKSYRMAHEELAVRHVTFNLYGA
jgi:hypothetical protein